MGRKTLLIALYMLVYWIAGCVSTPPVSNINVALVLEQSHEVVKAGESVTFTAHATGVAGRDHEIKWKNEGGDFSSLGEERYARVQYDKPGIYSVTASLFLDGKLVDQRRAQVKVDPLS